ncbi:ABC transporter permease [Paracoccus pantotrophus]|uniref:ABC transporter permease n=1 Tax=Paracoccus pantotrophus TaxID=82367 RepID=UPI00056318E4|nr:ABC transporter permease [Paracoccus pantotrophus]
MTLSVHPVVRIVLQRLMFGLLTLFLVSVIIFASVEMLPGSYANAILGQSATPETVAALEQRLGLDQPAYIRYFEWIGNAVQGDLGSSFAGGGERGRPVAEVIGPRLGNTMFLAMLAALVAVPVAIILGLLTALYRNTWFDRICNGFGLGLISLPEFFVAYLLTYVIVLRDSFAFTGFAAALPAWATSGIEWLLHALPQFPILANVNTDASFWERSWSSSLPAITLTLVTVSHMMRMTRATIINLLASPYIEMARLKGVSPFAIVVSHALPNAWAPIANVIAFNLAYLIVGVVVVEVVFVYPGVGQLMVDAVRSRDIPVVQACALIFAATYILLNLAADIISIVTNPRLLHPRG